MSRTTIHPIVRIDYRYRAICDPLLATIMYTLFAGSGRVGPGVVAALILFGLGWPHVAFFLACRAGDSRQAEHWNMQVDSLLVGIWIAVMHFSLWPSVLMLATINLGNLGIGGTRLAGRGLLAIALGVLATGLATGFAVNLASPPLTVITSIVGIFAVSSTFSIYAYGLSKRFVAARRAVQNQQLSLQEQSAQLEQARDEAETASRSKSLFLANMSHELRTPLNAIIGYSELLMEEAQDAGEAGLVPDLKKIHVAGKHLLGLINEVLDLSKIEAGKMDLYLEQIDVTGFLQGVVSTVEPLTRQKNNTLQVDSADHLGSVHSDVTKLRQMLFNLLGNASKFTENGQIHLRTRRDRGAAGDWLVFEVQDTGIGMSPEQQAKLFQPFVQADAETTRKYGGTGLGLVITRHFAEMLGGDIRMRSEVGVGTTFTLRIPADMAAGAAETVPTESAEATRPDARSVLVIDDDAAGCDLIRRMLVREGFRTLTAADGSEGLRMARENVPDLILLDVLMPGTDGWSVLAQLKDDPALADIPVVMISVTRDNNLGFALGASDYLVKPVQRQVLVDTLRKYLGDRTDLPVLIVDDDATTRSMLRRVLERQNLAVVEAVNGVDALLRMDEVRPGLILLDLMMPKMDGFGFLEALRKRDPADRPPVVVLSAKELTRRERKQLASMAQNVFEKGRYSAEQLEQEVRQALAAHHPTTATSEAHDR